MKINLGKYVLKIEFVKKIDDMDLYTSIDTNIPQAEWLSRDYPSLHENYANWKTYIGVDKIKAIKALRSQCMKIYSVYPSLKTAKDYVEWYATKEGKSW